MSIRLSCRPCLSGVRWMGEAGDAVAEVPMV